MLAIVQALANPRSAQDFWTAYVPLLSAFKQYNLSEEIKPALCLAADELYYWLRYANGAPEAANCRLESLQIGSGRTNPDATAMFHVNIDPLTNPDALRKLLDVPLAAAASPAAATNSEIPLAGGFVGWQTQTLGEALRNGENVLLAGPTGTGKTYALFQVVNSSLAQLVSVEGKEGLTDLDFIGAILPKQDGSRGWVDGPLLRALRIAETNPVLLFLDEINRIPRVHLNLLLGLMNPKSEATCRQMGLKVSGQTCFYVLEVPMTSEIVACPVAHLRIVAAGNFGRAYQVYELDPAVRRRFDTVIEFDYLDYPNEMALVRRETPGLDTRAAEVLVKVAQETRRLLGNGELPGCVDTASLLNWARKCQSNLVCSQETIMKAAKLTWADTVCGRDHTGRVNQGSFKALEDYVASLAIL